MGIPRLDRAHGGGKISFGSSALAALAGALVEIDLARASRALFFKNQASIHKSSYSN